MNDENRFGEIKAVELRSMWVHEALHFTPWLAANINKLGEAIGLELELIGQEQSVGGFSLDLLAVDLGSQKKVVIENQLTKTDHDHLGKLITYAAGFSASIVIWVAESIRDEHRQALDWLNQRTDEETLFFGVVIEVIKIDDSKPAFNFKIVVSPNEWQKRKSNVQSQEGVSVKGDKYRAYYQSLIDELREKYHFTNAKIGQPQNWYSFASGIGGVAYGANFCQGGRVRVEVSIYFGDASTNKAIFDSLLKEADAIETAVGEHIEWERLDSNRSSRVSVYRDGSIESPDAELEQIKLWQIGMLRSFKKNIGPRLKAIVDQLA